MALGIQWSNAIIRKGPAKIQTLSYKMSKSQAYNVQHGTTVSDNVSHIWKLLGERFSLQEKESWLYLVTDVNYTLSWSLCNIYKYQIAMLYTWNSYVVCQLHLRKQKKVTRYPISFHSQTLLPPQWILSKFIAGPRITPHNIPLSLPSSLFPSFSFFPSFLPSIFSPWLSSSPVPFVTPSY